MSLVDKNIKEQYRIKKEYKKKWKEEKLMKKMVKKQKDKKLSESHLTTNTSFIPTISIAVPGSIYDNAQSRNIKARLVGKIAKSACNLNVDEIIVYDDLADSNCQYNVKQDNISARPYCINMAKILEYLECPPYLRKYFFTRNPDLEFAAKIHQLHAPHHLGKDDKFSYREGVVANRPANFKRGSLVNVGLSKDIFVDKVLTPGLRVTVNIIPPNPGSKKIHGILVPPSRPKLETKTNWGYNVRIAKNLNSIFKESPFPEGYDLTMGTSDKGIIIDQVDSKSIPPYKHLLIVFGGISGIEAALENDPILTEEDASHLFNYYLNTCPFQGTRTIRSEEAITLSLVEIGKLLKHS